MGMKRSAALALAVAATAGAGTAILPATGATAAEPAAASQPSVQWGACPRYSEDVIKEAAKFYDLAKFKRQLARRECGTVTVPLGYDHPSGRKLRIAVTRFKATEPARRLGVLAVNPGGPGTSGVLLPAEVALAKSAELAKRYDLIGFDPRGVGDSTPRLGCDPDGPPGEFTTDRAVAKAHSDRVAKANRDCAAVDPQLTAALTTSNIARDMDQIRAALGESKLSYLGFSWGTSLGARYRTLYPQRVARMVLDSPVTPDLRLHRWDDDIAAAEEQNYQRYMAYLAKFDRVFGLGDTKAEVDAEVRRIRAFFTKNPQDVPDIGLVDEITVGFMTMGDSGQWVLAGTDLGTLKEIADRGARVSAAAAAGRRPAAPEPEFFNLGVNRAVFCNAETGIREFDGWFRAHLQRVQRFPLAGILADPAPFCIGWPHPAQPEPLSDTGSPVLLSGHRDELVTPFIWTAEMKAETGGDAITVRDDVHASVIDTACAAKVVPFLLTGARQSGSCAGIPEPTPDELRATAATRRGYVPGPYPWFRSGH
jgi:pimeloyl-ACP methyl ester carboxylesterase